MNAAVYLASQPPGRLTPIHQIAQKAGLRRPLLAKVIARLTKARIVRTYRGPGGGVELARAPEEICLWNLVQAMERSRQGGTCVFGARACLAERCPLHEEWTVLQERFQHLLESTTVAAIAALNDTSSSKERLS